MQTVHIGDRTLAFETWGSDGGLPVFLHHGTPGSRLRPRPRGLEMDVHGIRLITFDRPGYDGSDPFSERDVADAAADVAAIADALGIERFAVIGRSGGGPHSLACAAKLPTRVTAAASLVGLAPRDADGLDWEEGMNAENRLAYGAALQAARGHGLDQLLEQLSKHARAILQRTTDVEQRPAGLPEADQRILSDAGIRRVLNPTDAVAAADERSLTFNDPELDASLGHLLPGWVDDVIAFSKPWGFAVEHIAVPVILWHGEQDVFVPVQHTRWLADRIPGAQLIEHPDAGHLGSLELLPEVLGWLKAHSHRRT